MKRHSAIFCFAISFLLVVASGCTPPPVSIILLDWDGREAIQKPVSMQKYSGYVGSAYTIESFNARVKNAYEAKLFVRDGSDMFADSILLSKDSLFYFVNRTMNSIPIDSILRLEVFDESAFAGKAWRSAAVAGTFAGMETLAYLGPNKPNAKSFAIASSIGLGVGLVFAGRIPENCVFIKRSELHMGEKFLFEKYFGGLTSGFPLRQE
jgi:hypothetical protein